MVAVFFAWLFFAVKNVSHACFFFFLQLVELEKNLDFAINLQNEVRIADVAIPF